MRTAGAGGILLGAAISDAVGLSRSWKEALWIAILTLIGYAFGIIVERKASTVRP